MTLREPERLHSSPRRRRLFRRFRGGEFLEARIIPERIEHRIEPEESRSKRQVCRQWTFVWYREEFL